MGPQSSAGLWELRAVAVAPLRGCSDIVVVRLSSLHRCCAKEWTYSMCTESSNWQTAILEIPEMFRGVMFRKSNEQCKSTDFTTLVFGIGNPLSVCY